ncbi:c-type cytochrome [Hydrogenophaga sp. OTU3427]|uniref:c-type cytochrome n=1 Tax=Hydrogenophaga sp. OTU3427 TaxID=3043856 RepID=UPI00313F2792
MRKWKHLGHWAALACLPLAAQAQVAAAPKAFETCVACHSFKAGEHLNGPSLHQLIQRRAGSVEGFRYSGPMKRSSVVWDAASLRDFLKNPQALMPGNRMPYSGTDNNAELDELVAFLVRVGGQP